MPSINKKDVLDAIKKYKFLSGNSTINGNIVDINVQLDTTNMATSGPTTKQLLNQIIAEQQKQKVMINQINNELQNQKGMINQLVSDVNILKEEMKEVKEDIKDIKERLTVLETEAINNS